MAIDLNNVYTGLKHGAALSNTNLAQVCAKAGVHRATVEQWKTKPPRVFKILADLSAALETFQRDATTPTEAAAE